MVTHLSLFPMHTFKSFLSEEVETKLKHIEHVEDHPVNDGPEGFHHAVSALNKAHEHMKDKRHSSDLSMKYDGSPSLVYGHHPKTGKFFVASKSAFNKNPKINHTEADIEKNHGHAPGLVDKLKHALKHLPKIAPKHGVYQGDVLFSHGDVTHHGNGKHSFTPNTITYTAKGKEGEKVAKAKLGLVTHTQYHGDSIENMKSHPHPDMSGFKHHEDVYHKTAEHDTSKVHYTPEKQKEFHSHIAAAQKIHNEHGQKMYEPLQNNKEHVKTYINQTVRTGEKPNPEGLKSHIRSKYEKELSKLKTDKSKTEKHSQLNSHMSHIDKNNEHYKNLFNLHHHLTKAKHTLVDTLNQHHGGLEHHIAGTKSHPEGFVVHHDGKPSKLVDRQEFSKANFLKTR